MDYITKDDLRAALAPLPTREEIRSSLAAHPTREEMREEMQQEGERTRRHIDAVFESMGGDTRLLAEGYVALDQKINGVRAELNAEIAALARRVNRLELSRE